MSTQSPIKIQEKSDELQSIIGNIKWRNPAFLQSIFNWLSDEQPSMNDETKAKSLVEAGRFAVESQNWDRLREINYDLMGLLPKESKDDMSTKIGFGL